ncbi:hypothetical protein [Spirillospora sp. CA-128828]|uniref:hypothetical protein n=1 Tax=Spirillospora sp. CA-128828 TaxID=3240033 RepID=UPI003D932427
MRGSDKENREVAMRSKLTVKNNGDIVTVTGERTDLQVVVEERDDVWIHFVGLNDDTILTFADGDGATLMKGWGLNQEWTYPDPSLTPDGEGSVPTGYMSIDIHVPSDTKVEASVDGGSIHCPDQLNSPTLNATEEGIIVLQRVVGQSKVTTAAGLINIFDLGPGTADLTSTGGNIEVHIEPQDDAPNVTARTVTGDIAFSGEYAVDDIDARSTKGEVHYN